MDVIFAEDASRVRLDHAPEHFAVLRHVAFNLLKRHPYKASLKRKRFRAALDDSYLYQLLSQVCCDCPEEGSLAQRDG